MLPNAAATYRQTLERTMSPADLLIRLYEGAIRCLDLMSEGMKSGDLSKRADAVNRLTSILSELASAVEGQEPKDLSDSLVSLYLFLIQEITVANVANESSRLAPLREILSDLLGAWKTAAQTSKGAASVQSGTPSEAPRRTLSVRG